MFFKIRNPPARLTLAGALRVTTFAAPGIAGPKHDRDISRKIYDGKLRPERSKGKKNLTQTVTDSIMSATKFSL